jgi:hypothetical protein
MLPTLHLDDHATFQADEVHDIGAYRLLPLELQVHEAIRAQVVPEVLLGRRLR